MTIRYCYNDKAKTRVARVYKRQLRKVANAMGLTPDQYDLRFNPGGPAVWGEVTLHTDRVYIQASAGCDLGVLVRTCNGRRDYTGGRNHWVSELALRNAEGFVRAVNAILGVSEINACYPRGV